MICRIDKNIKKGCSPYVLPDVREIYLLNYSDFDGYDVDDCEYCLDWDESSKWYRIDVQNASFADALAIGNNQNKYRNVRLTFSLYNSKDACVEEAYNAIVLGKYVAVFFANGVWYVSGLLNGMTVNESASDSESHTITLEENTTLTSQILNAECAQDVVDSANGEEPTPPIPPEPPVTTDYMLAVFDVDDTTQPTQILRETESVISQISSIEIDGVVQSEIISSYQFDTIGTHFVKYNLVDNTKIPNFVLQNCTKLVDIYFPDTITSIGQSAFSSCTGLTNITIPNNVTSIGQSAFSSCTGLTNITIPDSVTSIGMSAFSHTSLTSVILPNTLTVISTSLFEDCSGLTSVRIPNTITKFGYRCFKDCPNLTSITIPNRVTSIGNNSFNGCSNLTTVFLNSNAIVSENYTVISGLKTYFGIQVTKYVIGNNIVSIGDYVFINSSRLTNITIEATTPPTLSNVNAFNGTNNCPIYVPAASVEAYKTATNWSSYADRIQPIT